jgi:hypothetical protein
VLQFSNRAILAKRGGSCKTLRQAQGEREYPLISLGIPVRGELVEPQIGHFARASEDSEQEPLLKFKKNCATVEKQ